MKAVFIAGLSALLMSATTFADELAAQKLISVYVCKDDIGFKTENNMWYVALKSNFYVDGVNRITTLALQSHLGNLPVKVQAKPAPIRWCGIDGVLDVNYVSLVK